MEQNEKTKNKKIRQQTKENKENIQPQEHIDNKNAKVQLQNYGDENIEERYKYLKKKINRETLDENESDLSRNEFNFINSNLRKKVSEKLKESKYSFNQNIKFDFISASRYDLRWKKETRIILNIIKSNISLPMINKTFVINEKGMACSQKTHNRHYISIGRQQINDQGIRPNDIMLFPTDPSISRSHFKIFHQEYFNNMNSFKKNLLTMLMLTLPKFRPTQMNLNINSIINHNKLNSDEIYQIMKYIAPPNKVAIEDNGTIFGTYVKVRSFSLESLVNNWYLFLKYKTQHEENIYSDNYDYNDSIENFLNNKSTDKKKIKQLNSCNNDQVLRYISENKNIIKEKFNYYFDYDNPQDRTNLESFICFADKHFYMNDYERLKENNFILKDYFPAVFLNGPKIGFIMVESGGISKIIEAIKSEYNSQTNYENFNPFIELISLDKLYDCQKLEINSNIFKAVVSKEEFIISLQYSPILNTCEILYLVEIVGDPCGIMNRCNEILFFVDKDNKNSNKKSFSFNFIKGFLVGNNSKSCYNINSESDSFIYYHNLRNSWMLTDLTRFTNPRVYYSDDYHGLWICISKDKRQNNRFQPKIFYVKSEDEIKVSETVIRIQIENDK